MRNTGLLQGKIDKKPWILLSTISTVSNKHNDKKVQPSETWYSINIYIYIHYQNSPSANKVGHKLLQHTSALHCLIPCSCCSTSVPVSLSNQSRPVLWTTRPSSWPLGAAISTSWDHQRQNVVTKHRSNCFVIYGNVWYFSPSWCWQIIDFSDLWFWQLL